MMIEGLTPAMGMDAEPTALPPIELHGLPNYKPSPLGMPGLFPGRVVEVHDPKAIVRNRVSQPIVRRLLEQAMPAPLKEWRRGRDSKPPFLRNSR